MLPRDLLRNEPDRVARALAERGVPAALFVRWQELDAARRNLLVEVEEWKRRRNEHSREIGRRKQQGEDAGDLQGAVAQLKVDLERGEGATRAIEEELFSVESQLPNLAHGSVPIGLDASANRVERTVGEPPRFDFEAKAHWDLGTQLGILDFERGARVAGARFTTYFGAGARLERALAHFMLDLHSTKHGYVEVLPPYFANRDALFGSGQLPKFEPDLWRTGDYFLIPTAEVPLVNLHRGEVLAESQLPLRYTAWTPCFRAEAGSYGRDVRGLIRQHQFHKVELVQLVTPQTSYQALEELTGHAERVLQLLELPYRTVSLATGDLGFQSAKTYDLEVWLPGQAAYREISSCSNCEDFQARRADLKYRPSGGGKPRFVHTLNGSGLAVGRTLVAVLENCQRSDGSVSIPAALRPYLRGLTRISPEGDAL